MNYLGDNPRRLSTLVVELSKARHKAQGLVEQIADEASRQGLDIVAEASELVVRLVEASVAELTLDLAIAEQLDGSNAPESAPFDEARLGGSARLQDYVEGPAIGHCANCGDQCQLEGRQLCADCERFGAGLTSAEVVLEEVTCCSCGNEDSRCRCDV